MRRVSVFEISRKIEELCLHAVRFLPEEVESTLQRARGVETKPLAKFMLDQIIENANIARERNWPLCQDTGMVVVFAEIGQEVMLVDGDITESINAGIARAYELGRFRKSVVRHPLDRVNTGSNTPAVIHYDIVPGETVALHVAPKGFGSENMSKTYMLNPTAGEEGVLGVILETVREAQGNPCPPLIVGVGIGGTIDKAALLAKKALLHSPGHINCDRLLARLEEEALRRINDLDIGPLGVGGHATALAVHVNAFPTHIAGLPVVVNLQCHAARHASATI